MTIDEKIEHLQASAMEQARAESQEILDAHRASLEKLFNTHKEETARLNDNRIKAETIKARQELNQSAAKAQLKMKRKSNRLQQDLKNQLFKEVSDLLSKYMQTEAYDDYLIRCIQEARRFAENQPLTIYINPSDEQKKSDLQDATGVLLTVSAEDFLGGIRAVIRERNILIDHSFKTALAEEYDKFMFQGGEHLA